MAYRCLFMDNDIYTAQDVNDALSNIISGGICGYPLGGGAMADLNSAIAELVNGGTDYKGTECLLVNDGGTYKISEGACIMNDGTQIIFDIDGYEISHEAGVYEYVYFERDVLHNRINVVVSDEAGGQDTIPIAEIKANGDVLDRRRFASAKVALGAEAENIGITKHILRHNESVFDVDIGFNGWRYIVYKLTDSRGYSDMGCLELPDGGSTTNFPTRNTDGYYRGNVTVTRNGSVLHFVDSDINPVTVFDIEFEVR